MSEEDPPAKRMRLGGDGLLEASREQLIAENKKQESYIASLLSKLDGNCTSGPQNELEERLKQQQAEANRKEKVLLMQLTRKEQDLQEVANQLGELTKGNTPGASQLRSALLDPALNLLFQRMRNQLEEKSKKLQQATDDMAAWKFTPDSQTGKRLMSKCRILIQENQELGKQVSTGRTAQLEAELALQKKYSEELKASQDELNEFVIQLDEEVEGMQSTICALQQQLKEAKEDLASLKVVQAEPVNTDQGPTEHQVHEQVVQQQQPAAAQQMKQPESPFAEEGIVSALLSPAQSSPPQIEVVGNKTPEVERTPEGDRTQGAGEEEGIVDGSDDKDHRLWSPDEMETVEEGNQQDERTAETNVSTEEEHEIASRTPEEETERTTKIIKEQDRTFSYEESETHRRPPQLQEEEMMSHQESGAEPRDALHKENQELQDRWEKPQPEEEQMEIDSPKCKNDTSSRENEVLTVEAKQSNFAGELTSPVASCESLTDGSNEGTNATTLDHGQTSQNLGVDPTPGDNIQNTDQTSLESSGSNDLGDKDSPGNKGTEESSTKNPEVPDISTKNQDNDIACSLEVSKSTVDNQPGIGKVVSESQGAGKGALLAQFSEVKVTAKKLPTNCSLSVVDYDTGSSEDEDYEGGNDGFVDEPSGPNNQTLSQTKHSPNNQSPESPNQSLSPGTNSPEPVNNTGFKLGPELSPLKSLQILSNNGDTEVGLLTKPNESQDSDIVEENGTESIHNKTEKVAISTE
ncbi:actin cytoskeleton-regulatory complex protein PAN1-like [Asterias rubens]|uniref:actin cytoskeleton-regulatory complex protein PAN1-like n=1 Tax=Asterias rubens TaxID=7604 RepID=UPI0014555015|nr:actin cytoskeleton-regulatory complex protein PAN1-like [Asterias rubens]